MDVGKKNAQNGSVVRIGVISRLDYPVSGFRRGLLDAAFEAFRYWGVEFVVVAGGLISRVAFNERVRALVERENALQEAVIATYLTLPEEERKKTIKPKREARSSIRGRILANELDACAEELARYMPHLEKAPGMPAKIYIVTAPAPSYDGKIGRQVANRLTELRHDIRFWREESARFAIPFPGRPINPREDMWVVLPYRGVWRNKDESTSTDRVIEDKELQSHQPDPPGFYIGGCPATSYMRPPGELARARLSSPGISSPEDVKTTENQVGALILEVEPGYRYPKKVFISFRDLESKERRSIVDPDGASKTQRAILAEIKNRPSTIGMLEHNLPYAREEILEEIHAYGTAGFRPAIVLKEGSGEYDVDMSYLQLELRHVLPPLHTLVRDAFCVFGCLHAGYPKTQYRYFTEQVPLLMLDNDIRIFVGAGDFVAGINHDLDRRGEVIHGLNVTEQEALAAELVLTVLLSVFKARFNAALKQKTWKEQCTAKRIRRMVDETLPYFLFWPGNHDTWSLPKGYTPLVHFTAYLLHFLEYEVRSYLRRLRLPVDFFVMDAVPQHVTETKRHAFASKLILGLHHPSMARTLTSARCRQALSYRGDCKVVALANFHTATELQRWDAELGQRVAFQVGTLATETEFEDGKMKRCDCGVGVLETYSHEGRIIATRSFFDSPAPEEILEPEHGNVYWDYTYALVRRVRERDVELRRLEEGAPSVA